MACSTVRKLRSCYNGAIDIVTRLSENDRTSLTFNRMRYLVKVDGFIHLWPVTNSNKDCIVLSLGHNIHI